MLSKSSFLATFIGNYKLNNHKQWLTVRALKPGLLEEDCPIKTLSEKKRFSIFFFKWNSKIQAFNYATFGNFKTVWTYLTFQEIAFKFYKCYSSVCKKKYWKSLDYHYWCNWNLEMSVFFGGGKLEYPAKNLSEQGREPAINSAHIWSRRWDLNPGRICERRVISPLGQIQISIYWSITVCHTHLWMKVYFFRKNNETKNLSVVRRYLLHGLLL